MKTLGFSLLCILSFVKTELRSDILSEIKLSWDGPEDIDPAYEPLLGEYVFSETEDVFTSKMSKAFVIKRTDESGTNWRLDLDTNQGYLLFSIYSGGGSINRNRVMLVKDGNYSAVPQITVDFTFTNLTTDRVLLKPIPPHPRLDDSDPNPGYRRCLEEDVESCIQVELNIEVLKFATLIELPDSTQMGLSERDETSAVFQNSGNTSEALFVWSAAGDEHVAGHVNLEAESFVLEGCGTQCYLWIKQSRSSTSSVEPQDFVEEREPRNRGASRKVKTEEEFYREGIRDTNGIKYISLMIWYTNDFYNSFDSEQQMINRINLERYRTNQGYKNSNIPMRVYFVGIKEHPTLQKDISDATEMLSAFENSMCHQELLNCADASLLFVHKTSACGMANYYGPDVRHCNNLGILKWPRAAECPYTFAHELGHNFGCNHNRRNSTGAVVPGQYNYGHLVQPKGQWMRDGYRTIMAYKNGYNWNQVNYWSSPAIILPETGTPTGVRGRNNNAKVLTDNRFGFGNCGNGDLKDGKCFPCCDSVKLHPFDHRVSDLFAGTYDTYHNKPEANGRSVYQHRDRRGDRNGYCLWYSGRSWVFGRCYAVGTYRVYIRATENTERHCMVGISSWKPWDTDPMTLTVECDGCCLNIEIISTNSDILDTWSGKNLLGAYKYQGYHNDRNYYKMLDRPTYCLYYGLRQWRVGKCSNMRKNSYYMITQGETNNRRCVTSAHDWKIWNDGWMEDKDRTIHVKCNDKN